MPIRSAMQYLIEQCNTNIKFLTEYEYEYIRNGKFHQIPISNIFILSKLVEYEYQIYSFLGNWSNTNIYIHNQKIKYLYSNI